MIAKASFGATGALVGLAGGPVGALIGAAVGAVVGHFFEAGNAVLPSANSAAGSVTTQGDASAGDTASADDGSTGYDGGSGYGGGGYGGGSFASTGPSTSTAAAPSAQTITAMVASPVPTLPTPNTPSNFQPAFRKQNSGIAGGNERVIRNAGVPALQRAANLLRTHAVANTPPTSLPAPGRGLQIAGRGGAINAGSAGRLPNLATPNVMPGFSPAVSTAYGTVARDERVIRNSRLPGAVQAGDSLLNRHVAATPSTNLPIAGRTSMPTPRFRTPGF
jgi:hypothetical protein